MKRRLLIPWLLIVGLAATVVALAQATSSPAPVPSSPVQVDPQRREALRLLAGPQPDTTSPNWRFLSNDVGIQLRENGRFGLRARLYVKFEDAWWPVATDGPADFGGVLPAE